MPSGCARSSNNRVQPRRGCSPDVVYIRSREARAHEFLCTLGGSGAGRVVVERRRFLCERA